MAAFFYVKDAPDGRFALANAKRILTAAAFAQTVNQRVDQFGGRDRSRDFGLVDILDHPDKFNVHEHGDEAIETFGGPERQEAAWFVKIGGVWREDVTPPPPRNAADPAVDLEEDNASIDRITAAVTEG